MLYRKKPGLRGELANTLRTTAEMSRLGQLPYCFEQTCLGLEVLFTGHLSHIRYHYGSFYSQMSYELSDTDTSSLTLQITELDLRSGQ